MEKVTPDPLWCQVQGCTKLGQEVLHFGEWGSIRVCLYHAVVIMIPACKLEPVVRADVS